MLWHLFRGPENEVKPFNPQYSLAITNLLPLTGGPGIVLSYKTAAKMLTDNEDPTVADYGRTVLYEAGFLILGSFAVLLAWTTCVYMHTDNATVGLGLAFAGLMLMRQFDPKIYTEDVPNSIYITRFIVAASLNVAALAFCGFRILTHGPGAPLKRSNRARWFDAYGKRGRYGPMIESYTGILCTLAYARSLEYLVILGSRAGSKIMDRFAPEQ